MDIVREKVDQARRLVAASDLDVWCTFVRETAGGSDPVLSFLLNGGLTWQSALLVFKSGRTAAVVGNFDAEPLVASGIWDTVHPYVQGIRAPLLDVLRSELPRGGRVGVNYSKSDVKCDGLTHGMHELICGYLEGSGFDVVSAEEVCRDLRALKTKSEVARIKGAIAETELIFARVPEWCHVCPSELHLFKRIQTLIDELKLGYAWDREGDPIVNSGPDSMVGHGTPSESIIVSPGHILHIDLGVIRDGYSSDIQRCWYVPHRGEAVPPPDVVAAFNAVVDAITVGADALRPGVEGWMVDEAARSCLVRSGYPEYMHALGHQVGRQAHDGGAILGPKWERYGHTPFLPIKKGQVFTIELGVIVEGRGYLGLEEMVLVIDDKIEWLTERQLDIPLL
ncbi:MAG TPA: M24 family metallopeptidase [Fimbriimonadaceae bacterium]|nr:M24 family metallopeptidase [Fimbriimonadaceae bacterium]